MAANQTVGIVGRQDVYACGLRVVLESEGFNVDLSEDGNPTAHRCSPAVAVVLIRTDDDWRLPSNLLKRDPNISLVLVVSDPTLKSYFRGLSEGACSVVDEHASRDVLLHAVAAALRKLMVLPLEIARNLIRPEESDSVLAACEIAWLRQLADGMTIAVLAKQLQYSEREMYRILHEVYGKLGAHSKTDALLRASRAGLLEPNRSDTDSLLLPANDVAPGRVMKLPASVIASVPNGR